MRKIVTSTLLLLTVITSYSQDEFLLFGNINSGSPKQEVKITTVTKQLKRDTIVANENGDYKLFLKYGENYKIKVQSENKLPLLFECKLVLPSNVKQCCYTPLNLSFRLFEQGQPTDTLFKDPIHIIKYEKNLNNFNYSVDIDFLVEQKKVEAKMEKQRLAYSKKKEKETEDSMRLEARYMNFIERGNLYFKAKNFTKAKEMYLSSLEVKPNREYPKYKLEDIKTEITLFNTKNNDTATIVYQEKPLIEPKIEKPKKTYTYLTSNDIDKLIQADIERHVKKNTNNNDSAKAAVALFNDVIKEAEKTFLKPKEEPKQIEEEKEQIAEKETQNEQENTKTDTDTAALIKEPIENIAVSNFEIIEIDTNQTTNEHFSESDMPIIEAPNEPFDYEKYQDSLKKIYIDERTVEINKSEEKTTTKVIINKNNEITIFIKVAHNWGGVFYFIEKTPKTLENISNAFFYASTGLKNEEKDAFQTKDSTTKSN